MKHRLMLVVGVGVLLGGLTWAGLGQAAQGGEVCVIKGSATISPGLTTKAQSGTVSISGNLTNCHGTNLAVKSGTVSATASGTGSCASSSDTLNGTISWNTGQTSAVSGTLKSVGAAANFLGTVTSGLFQGSKLDTTAEFSPASGPTGALACKGAGLTNVTFTGVTS